MTSPILAGTSRARVPQDEARQALDFVTGMSADRALAALRFNPGQTCPELERVIVAGVARSRDVVPDAEACDVFVVSGEIGAGDAVTRLRRHAHGDAYWLTTQTTSIELSFEFRGGHEGGSTC